MGLQLFSETKQHGTHRPFAEPEPVGDLSGTAEVPVPKHENRALFLWLAVQEPADRFPDLPLELPPAAVDLYSLLLV